MHTNHEGRQFLRSDGWSQFHHLETDQKRKLPPPPMQKPLQQDLPLLELPDPLAAQVGELAVREAIRRRRSQRAFTAKDLSLEELSYLLWATQGISRTFPERGASLRSVPSAGGRHPFETYLLVNRVGELTPGLYLYRPLEHRLVQLDTDDELAERVHTASNDQYVLESAVTFIWTALPYRTEWRYGPLAHKMIAMDAGHLCQNLYLACESIGAGTCAIGAYDQAKMDAVLNLDGEQEFTFYMAPVGYPA